MTTVSAQIEAQVWRVVVIDDSPDDRAEVRRLLLKGSERRYQFVEAETGAAGVRAALDPVAGPPGCVVLDYNLPDLDAVEVLAALAGPDGLTACPVVVLTGTVGHEHTRAVLRAGAQDYLGKGWMTPESLTRAVENATERWVMARELRKQKAALKTSDDRFRLAADAVNGIIYEWDILTGHVERQRGLYEVLGYHAVEVPLTAAWWREQIHPDDLEVVEQQFTELAGNSVVSEYRVRHRDGRWLHLEDRAVLLRGDDDRPVKMVGCAVDITDRKRAEERLRYSEQLHRVAFDQSPTGMVYVGADGRLIKVNPAMCVITGYPAEELVGMKVSDLTHPDDLAADAELVTPFLRGDTLTYENDKRYVRKDGGVRWVSITERMVTDAEGQPLHSVGVVRDITERKRVEGERQLLASIVENSSDFIGISDTQGNPVYGNRAAMELVGVQDLEQVWRTKIVEYFVPEQRPFVAEVILPAVVKDGRWCGELTMQHFVTGATIPVWYDLFRVDDPVTGRPINFATITRDLTESKRAVETLRASEAFNRSLMEGSADCVKVLDLDGRLLHMNSPGLCLMEIDDIGPLCGQEWPALWPAEAEVGIRRAVAAASGGDSYSFRAFCPTAKGTPKWWDVVVSPVCNAAGRAVHLLAVSRDITAYKEAEDALSANEERLRMALAAAQAGAWAWEVSTEVITWSPENYELYGYDPQAGGPPAYADWKERVHPDDRTQAYAAVDDALAGRTPEFRSEFRVTHPTRGDRWLLGLGRVEFAPNGEPLRVVGINLDITDRKRTEQLMAEQDVRKDEFLATLAHELRNPLAPIRSGVAVLRMTHAPELTEKTLGIIDRQLGHLVNLVDDLLDVSRVRAGKITLRTEQVTVRDAVDAAVEACRPAIDEKSHTLDVDLPAESLAVTGDKTRLVQVVANLLTNAAKYSEPGGHIRITVKRDGKKALVSVSDTGMGIARETLPTLWDMFTQVRDTLDKAQGGLGIGLSLVKKLVEMHGGSVAAESAGVGRGSTFTVLLPLASASMAAAPSVPLPESNGSARPAARRVLVVDDNVDGAEILARLLTFSGHRVEAVHSGPAALEAAQMFLPDVVLLDIGLPGMDGYEVAKRLRADPTTAAAVLVALTGWGNEDDKRKCREAGFDVHLTKPVEFAALTDALSRSSSLNRRDGSWHW